MISKLLARLGFPRAKPPVVNYPPMPQRGPDGQPYYRIQPDGWCAGNWVAGGKAVMLNLEGAEVLPGTVRIQDPYLGMLVDDGNGHLVNIKGERVGRVNYALGYVDLGTVSMFDHPNQFWR